MNVIKNSFRTEATLLPESRLYFSGLKAAVIDIETTGLSPENSFIYLIGVMTESENTMTVTQFLASDSEDEAIVLTEFSDFIRDYDVLLNYNGTSFDIPFINRRCAKTGIPFSIDLFRSIDYLRIFKASYLPEITGNLKLKTVEKYAGIFRQDTISGKEGISLYREFSENHDREAGRKILLHNYEDLTCFTGLNSLAGKINLHYALYKTGYPVKSGSRIFFIRKINAKASGISVSGTVTGLEFDFAVYEEHFSLVSESLGEHFVLNADYSLMRNKTGAAEGNINSCIIGILENI